MMNVKPYVMGTHPEYAKLVKQGALFTDPMTGTSAVARLWSAGVRPNELTQYKLPADDSLGRRVS